METLHRRLVTVLALVSLAMMWGFGSATPADAGTNGQLLTIRAASRNSQGAPLPGLVELVVTGNNQKNPLQRVTWSWRGGATYSVTTTNWWWKGAVTIQAKYANGASKTCSGNVPTISLSNAHVVTCSSDVPNQAPAAPSNPRLSNGTPTSFLFSWNDNAGLVNGELGFLIERRNGGGWAHVGIAGANTTSYISSGLNPNTSYCFRVRAYNSTGLSSYSSETCATTPPKKRVGIQAGHWKVNELPAELAWGRTQTGTAGGGTTEWRVTLNIANLTANLLRQRGYDVDVVPATVPEQYKPDVFIALHTDGNRSSTPNGYKVTRSYYTANVSASERLVSALFTEFGKSTRLASNQNNVTKDMRYYFAFNYAAYKHAIGKDVPAAILEMGFLTSPTDQQILIKNPNLAAEGIANAVSVFFK